MELYFIQIQNNTTVTVSDIRNFSTGGRLHVGRSQISGIVDLVLSFLMSQAYSKSFLSLI